MDGGEGAKIEEGNKKKANQKIYSKQIILESFMKHQSDIEGFVAWN